MVFTPQRRTAPEMLDLPLDAYAVEELEETLADIRVINRYLGDVGALLKHLAPLVAGTASFTLLDIATGSADLPIAMVDWARRRGIRASVTGVDINRLTVDIAKKQTATYPEIKVDLADGLELPYPDKSFDFVVCSKTTHHMPEEEVVRLIGEMLRVARNGYLIMDIRRSWIAYLLITILTRLFTRNRLTRYDGPLSVLKSFTSAELAAAASRAGAEKFTIRREPFWLMVLAGELP